MQGKEAIRKAWYGTFFSLPFHSLHCITLKKWTITLPSLVHLTFPSLPFHALHNHYKWTITIHYLIFFSSLYLTLPALHCKLLMIASFAYSILNWIFVFCVKQPITEGCLVVRTMLLHQFHLKIYNIAQNYNIGRYTLSSFVINLIQLFHICKALWNFKMAFETSLADQE